MVAKIKDFIVAVCFITFTATSAHLLLSCYGFSATDEGWELAIAKRIILGQVPHRDFIFIRPVGAQLLLVPLVLFGGNYVLWLSKLLHWMELSCLSWCWVIIIVKLSNAKFNTFEKICLGLIMFMYTSSFWYIHFYTLTGFLLISLGLVFSLSGSKKTLGYILVGASSICKQNYFLMIPASIICLGNHKRLTCWFASLLAGLIYLVVMGYLGALNDMFVQLAARGWSDLITWGITSYFKNYRSLLSMLAGFFYSILVTFVMNRKSVLKIYKIQFDSALVVNLLTYVMLVCLSTPFFFERYLYYGSYILFGFSTGLLFCMLLVKKFQYVPVLTLALFITWVLSISTGWTRPSLGGGILIVLILSIVTHFKLFIERKRKFFLIFLIFFFFLTAISFSFVKCKYICRDKSIENLKWHLTGVFNGAYLLKTSKNNFEFLSDLNIAISKTNNRDFAILPELAAYWVLAKRPNPVVSDWPLTLELPTERLYIRLQENIMDLKGKIVFIIQKVTTLDIAYEFKPFSDSEDRAKNFYSIVPFVKRNFTKFDETKFFELYT